MSSRHEVEIKITAANLSDPAFKSLIADLKNVGTASQETSTRMQSVGNAAKTGGAGILTMAGNIGSLVTGVWAGTQMLTGFVGTTARVMGGVLNLNAGLEMTTVAFEQLTGSASSANALMDELRQMAKETPFEFPELAQSAQLLLAFGDAAEDVTDHLTIIGDTVAAFGGGAAEIDKVTRALGQMTAKGKVQGEEMLQLAEMGINGYKILAEQMGITTEQVMELGQKGKLVASEAVPMLYEGLQKAFGGGMAKQAETFTGMISNLRDAFNMAAADISKPIFDKAKESLADLVAYTETADFEAQIDAWTVKAGEFADSLGSFVQNEGPALLRMMGDIADKTADMAVFAANLPNSPLAKFLENAFTTGPNQATGNDDLNRLSTLNDQAGVIVDIVAGLDQVEWAWARITGNSERADEIAARYATRWNQSEIKPGTDHFINLSDQTLMVDDASKVYDEAAKMASQYFDTVITGEDAMKGFVEVQGVGTVNMEQFIRAVVGLNPLLAAQALAMQQSSDATQDATSTKAAYMQHVYEENAALADQRDAVTELMRAQQDLETVQSSLSDAYQIGLKIQKDYGSQASEYASQASNIEESMKIIQRKQEEGIELTEQEIFIRDHATDALGRYQGGQEDAALTAGEYAIRNGMVMKAQDELNAALGRGEISQEEYIQKMKDAYAAAGLTYDATANNSTVMGTMSSTIANELVPAILNLIQKLDELNGRHVTATVETRFITTGSPVGQVYGQSVSGGYIGVEENAAGGVIDHPMLSMVGEEAPAHPEFIIPTNPSRRGRAMGLWLDAGRALGVPGFADGGGGRTLAGNTGGVAAGQPVSTSSGGGGNPSYLSYLDQIIADLEAVSQRFDDDDLKNLKDFASAARDGVGLVSSTLDLLSALSKTTVDYSPRIQDGIAALKAMAEHVTDSVGDSAALFDEGFLTHAKAYADAGGEAVGLISDALGLFQDLGDTAVSYTPEIAESVSALKFMAEHATRSIADSAAMFSSETLESAKLFAETAGPIVGLLKDGADGFAAVRDFMPPAEQNIDLFLASVDYMVDKLVGQSTQRFEKGGLDAASRYAQTAGDIVSILDDGTAGFRALRGFRAPAQQDIDEFLSTTDYVVDAVNTAAARFEKDGLEQASLYADTGSTVLDLISGALDMEQLRRFIPPKEQALNDYLLFVDNSVARIEDMAKSFSDDGLKAASDYANAAGTVLDLIIKSSDFNGLKKYRGGLLDGIDDYFEDVKAAVQKINDLGDELDQGLDDAKAVAEKVNIIVDLLTADRDSSSGSTRGSGGGGSSSSGGSGFNTTDVRNGTVRIGNTINLTMADGNQVAQWYADQQYRDEQLAPVGIGG